MNPSPALYRRDAWIACGLIVVVLVAFSPVLDADFILFDDPHYILENPPVLAGLTVDGVRWSLTTFHAQNWHPLTWWSHMLDVQLWGVDPHAMHAVNLAMHAVNALLVYLFFRTTTGRLGPSALTAALFALHPLAVESVGWISERKNLLSTLLGLLCLCAYSRYARRPSLVRYAIVFLLFAGSLAAKPMLVTLPLAMLLLDFWPLERYAGAESSGRRFRRLLWEKTPLMALTVASCTTTLLAQRSAMAGAGSLPISWRIFNAVVAYATYLRQALWPAGLAIPAPHPAAGISATRIAVSFLLLLAVSAVVWRLRRPESTVGWLWFLGTLVPVIGIVQVGKQATADRYAYIPLLGIFFGTAFPAAQQFERIDRRVLCALSVLWAASLSAATYRQSHYWKNSEKLFAHSLAVDANNPVAAYLLGMALEQKGDPQAEVWLSHAVRTGPNDLQARMALGQYLADHCKFDAAAGQLTAAIELAPNLAEPRVRRGIAHAKRGAMQQALADFESAVWLEPTNADAWFNLALAQLALGRTKPAEQSLESAVHYDPNLRAAWLQLGLAKLRSGDAAAGVSFLTRAASIAPISIDAANVLAWTLATHPDGGIRDGVAAVQWIESASSEKDPALLDTLAAAYAEAGRFAEAIPTARRAEELARRRGDARKAERIRGRIELYSKGRAYREDPASSGETPAPSAP